MTRFPTKLNDFFDNFRQAFLFDHFHYFQLLVFAFTISYGRRNVTNVYRHVETKKPRNRVNNFFLVSHRFDLPNLLRQKAYDLVKRLDPKPGETIDLILDDSKKAKRGKSMAAVGWLFDPATKKSVQGQNYLVAILRFRGFLIPFAAEIYVKKEHVKDLRLKHRKLTTIAAEMIRSFDPPCDVSVRVLFDRFYLCQTVTEAIAVKGFQFLSVLKSNRVFFKNGRRLRVASHGKNQFRRNKRKIKRCHEIRGKKTVTYTYIDAGIVTLQKIGQVRLIYSKRGTHGKFLAIVSSDLEASAEEILLGYANRFFIEQYFKDCKQLLGLGQHQNRDFDAAVVHLHLVCFSYALLTHLAISDSSEKTKIRNPNCHSIAKLQNQLRRLVFEETLNELQSESKPQRLIKRMKRLVMRAA